MAAKRKNALPFSDNAELPKADVATLDLSAIEKLADEVDAINRAEEGTKKSRKKRIPNNPQDGSAPKDLGEEHPEPLFTPDPEFQFMVTHITSGAIEITKRKLNWSDPGVQWKEKVGLTVFKLTQRIAPMGDSWMTDLATLVGYVGLWSASNVLFTEPRATQSEDTIGDNGQRKDVQDERATLKGGESFTL